VLAYLLTYLPSASSRDSVYILNLYLASVEVRCWVLVSRFESAVFLVNHGVKQLLEYLHTQTYRVAQLNWYQRTFLPATFEFRGVIR